MGKITRLRDDGDEYGPEGKGFIAEDVKRAYWELVHLRRRTDCG